MSKRSQEYKDRRAELLPGRMAYAQKKLRQAGYAFTCPDDMTIAFRFRCETVLLYPYNGWFTGKSVKDGRGIQNLLNQIAHA